MERIVPQILHELATPPILVYQYPDWDAVADNSRPFRLYCDASIDGFGATLEQEQPDGSVRPIVFNSRTPLSTTSDPGPPSTSNPAASFGPSNASAATSGPPNSTSTLTTRHLTVYPKSAKTTLSSVAGWNSSTPTPWSTEKAQLMAMPTDLSRLPQPATDLDRTGPNRFTTPDTIGIYLIQACGFTPIDPFNSGIGLGGLVPISPIPCDTIPPLPCTDNDFGDFRRHRPRMDNSDLVHTPYSIVASAAVQDTAVGSSRRLLAGPHFAQDTAAGSYRSLPAGLCFILPKTPPSTRFAAPSSVTFFSSTPSPNSLPAPRKLP